jgi:hypothetical protein
MPKKGNLFTISQYYKSVDYSLWDDIFLACKEKLEDSSDDIRKQWSAELYSKYLQILEILCINMVVVGKNDIEFLFINNKNLKKEVLKIREDRKIVEVFLNQAVFYICEKERIKDYEERKGFYRNILRESLEDYLKDYDFLNAYKHGFRVESKGKSTISIEGFSTKYNATISYFTREQVSESRKIIFKNTICFNWERVLYKSFFILDMLKKLKVSSSINHNEEVVLETLFVLNERHFEKTFGTFRSKDPFLVSES